MFLYMRGYAVSIHILPRFARTLHLSRHLSIKLRKSGLEDGATAAICAVLERFTTGSKKDRFLLLFDYDRWLKLASNCLDLAKCDFYNNVYMARRGLQNCAKWGMLRLFRKGIKSEEYLVCMPRQNPKEVQNT